MPRKTVDTHMVSFETRVAVQVPGSDKIVSASVQSDVMSGMTITLPTGAPMWSLHDLFASGLIDEVHFTYKPAEKAD